MFLFLHVGTIDGKDSKSMKIVLDICTPSLIQFNEKATNQRGKASVSLVCVSLLSLMLVLYTWNLILELETLIMKHLIKKPLTNKP